VAASAGTANGIAFGTAQYVNLATDTAGAFSTTVTLAGAATTTGATLTLTQVSGANAVVSSGGVIVITQAARIMTPANFTSSTFGSLVKILAATTSTDVTVIDQFGTAMGSGYTVTCYRGTAVIGNFVASGTTNSSGVATVVCSPLSTVVTGGAETYVFTAQGQGLAETAATSDATTNQMTVTYTTTGNITTSSTAITGVTGATTPITAAMTAAANLIYPVITIPGNDGVSTLSAGTQIYTVATGVVSGSVASELVTLTTTNVAANTTTYTADTGAYVSTTATPTAAHAVTTATVSSTASVYIYAKTAGLHTITVTSGGLTQAIKVWAVTAADSYYDLSATALASSLTAGGNTVMTMTLKDQYGNTVDAADGLVTATASGSVRLAGGALTQSLSTGAGGTISFTVVADAVAGTGTVVLAPSTTGAAAWLTGFTKLAASAAPVSTVTVTFTVTASTVKTVDELSTELAAVSAALTAKIAADTAADAAADAEATAAAAVATLPTYSE
jgi:hypothetical protein